jgi:TRAP-type C4-dicarboxylate transport system permease small subunit
MEFFRRLDRAWARGEGAVTVLVLLSMVFVAAFSAGVRNLTRFDIQWANEILTDMEWADSFLRKATMWLAFLGASQACYYRKHISIDVLVRIAPLKQRYMMHAAAGLIAALITFAMSYSLWKAVELNLAERPIEYEMLTETGSQHVCDATPEQLKVLEGVEAPTSFCAVRTVLKVFGIVPETPGSAFQLIVPFMFMVMGLRFLGAGATAATAVVQGEEALLKLEAEEHARQAAVETAAGASASPLAIDPSHHTQAVAGGAAATGFTTIEAPEEEELDPAEQSLDEAYADAPSPDEIEPLEPGLENENENENENQNVNEEDYEDDDNGPTRKS